MVTSIMIKDLKEDMMVIKDLYGVVLNLVTVFNLTFRNSNDIDSGINSHA